MPHKLQSTHSTFKQKFLYYDNSFQWSFTKLYESNVLPLAIPEGSDDNKAPSHGLKPCNKIFVEMWNKYRRAA